MEVLHLLRTEPDETVTALIAAISGPQAQTIPLYASDLDWNRLIDDIFAAEQVISWW